jgi:excinuclease ABC subunit A
LKPLSDTPGLEGYSRDSNRVEVSNGPGHQNVVIIVHNKADIDTPAFRSFLRSAVETFLDNSKNSTASLEANMPWKMDGRKWHLSEKGFPPGRKVKWDRALLPRLLKLVSEVEPDIEIKWDTRDAILLKLPGNTRGWSKWKTKEADSLECRFFGKPGQFNLSRVERFGVESVIERDRNDGLEVITLRFTHADQLYPTELAQFLIEHARGFLEHFGKDVAA